MAEEKPRLYQGGKDMFLSLGAIILVMALSVGFTGMCSFNKDAAEHGPVREVDPTTFIQIESGAMQFDLRQPPTFEGWIPNSARRMAIGGEPAPTIGWVVNKDSYVQLSQSGLNEQAAVAGYDEHPRELKDSHNAGEVKVNVYVSEQRDVRPLYVADLGGERLIVTGAAPKEDFDRIIEGTAQAPVVQPGS